MLFSVKYVYLEETNAQEMSAVLYLMGNVMINNRTVRKIVQVNYFRIEVN